MQSFAHSMNQGAVSRHQNSILLSLPEHMKQGYLMNHNKYQAHYNDKTERSHDNIPIAVICNLQTHDLQCSLHLMELSLT